MSDRFDHTLERKLESKPAEADDGVVNIRRIELITGVMPEACSAHTRRRRWATTDKMQIVVESFEPGVNVSEMARRHGISPQQLFAWRREARVLIAEKSGELSATIPVDQALTPEPRPRSSRPQPSTETAVDAPAFAHVVIAASPAAAPPSAPPLSGGHRAPSTIEITIGNAIVRVVGPVETAMLVAVLRAVRRSS